MIKTPNTISLAAASGPDPRGADARRAQAFRPPRATKAPRRARSRRSPRPISARSPIISAARKGCMLACADFIVETIQAIATPGPRRSRRPRPKAATRRRHSSTPCSSAWSPSSSPARRPASSCSSSCASCRMPTAALDTHLQRRVRADPRTALPRSGQQATGEPAESDRTKITRVHDDRPGRLFPHRPRGGDAPHGLDRHRPRTRRQRSLAVANRQSRGDPRRPKRRQAMSFLCSIPLAASLFSGLRRPRAARRRLCRGRLCAAGADRGRAGASRSR